MNRHFPVYLGLSTDPLTVLNGRFEKTDAAKWHVLVGRGFRNLAAGEEVRGGLFPLGIWKISECEMRKF